MTCIIAYKQQGIIYWGADSCVNSYEQRTLKESKIFQVGDITIGISGSLRIAQIIQYHLKPKKHKPGQSNLEYLTKKIIPRLREVTKEHGQMKSIESMDEFDAYCLLGYRNNIYSLGVGFSIKECYENYEVVGSGHAFALGALYACGNTDSSPFEKITKALEASEYFCDSVRSPFRLFQQDGSMLTETISKSIMDQE